MANTPAGQQWKLVFTAADTGKKGKLTLEQCLELKRKDVRRHHQPFHELAERKTLAEFVGQKKKKDGMLDFSEFLQYIQGDAPAPPSPRTQSPASVGDDEESSSDEETELWRQKFARLDVNGVGFITVNEFLLASKEDARREGRPFYEAAYITEIREFFKTADLNQDEKLDFNEFITAVAAGREWSDAEEEEEEDVKEAPVGEAGAIGGNGASATPGAPGAASGPGANGAAPAGAGGKRPKKEKKKRMPRRRIKRPQPIVTVYKSANSDKKWHKVKNEVVDPESEVAREDLRRLFKQLDVDKDGKVELDKIVSVEQQVQESRGAVEFKADTDSVLQKLIEQRPELIQENKVDFVAFCEVVGELQLTNAELRAHTDVVTGKTTAPVQEQLRVLLSEEPRDMMALTESSLGGGSSSSSSSSSSSGLNNMYDRPDEPRAKMEAKEVFSRMDVEDIKKSISTLSNIVVASQEAPSSPDTGSESAYSAVSRDRGDEMPVMQKNVEVALGMAESLMERVENANTEATQLRQKLAALQELVEQLRMDKAAAEARSNDLTVRVADLEAKKEVDRLDLERLNKELKAEREERSRLTEEGKKKEGQGSGVSVFQGKAEMLEKQRKALEDEVKKLQEHCNSLSTTTNKDKQQLALFETKLKEMDKSVAHVKLESEEEKKMTKMISLHKQESLLEKLQEHAEKTKKVLADNTLLRAQLTEQQKTLNDRHMEIETLKQEVAKLRLVRMPSNRQLVSRNNADSDDEEEKFKKASDEKDDEGKGGDKGGAAAEKASVLKDASKRTFAERNKEFFFLTALAVKMNVETKLKALAAARGQPKPTVPTPPTKKLYEVAMKQRVPFQYYYKWLEKFIDPSLKKDGSMSPPPQGGPPPNGGAPPPNMVGRGPMPAGVRPMPGPGMPMPPGGPMRPGGPGGPPGMMAGPPGGPGMPGRPGQPGGPMMANGVPPLALNGRMGPGPGGMPPGQPIMSPRGAGGPMPMMRMGPAPGQPGGPPGGGPPGPGRPGGPMPMMGGPPMPGRAPLPGQAGAPGGPPPGMVGRPMPMSPPGAGRPGAPMMMPGRPMPGRA